MKASLRVGVIGIGAMGMGVAKSLMRAGFAVRGRDIRPEADAEAHADTQACFHMREPE